METLLQVGKIPDYGLLGSDLNYRHWQNVGEYIGSAWAYVLYSYLLFHFAKYYNLFHKSSDTIVHGNLKVNPNIICDG